MKKLIPLLVLFYSTLAFTMMEYDYRWDDYGLCGKYNKINGAFEGHSPFLCNPPEIDPDLNGGPAKWRVYTDFKTKKLKCGEFTAGGFFVRDVNKGWYRHVMQAMGDKIRESYKLALKDRDLYRQIKPYVELDGTPSLVGFYCSRKEMIPNRGGTKIVGAPIMLKRRRMKSGKYKSKCGFFRYRESVKEKFVGFFKREKFVFVPLNKKHCI